MNYKSFYNLMHYCNERNQVKCEKSYSSPKNRFHYIHTVHTLHSLVGFTNTESEAESNTGRSKNTNRVTVCLRPHREMLVGHSRVDFEASVSCQLQRLFSSASAGSGGPSAVRPPDNHSTNNISNFQTLSKFPAFTARKTSMKCVFAALCPEQ